MFWKYSGNPYFFENALKCIKIYVQGRDRGVGIPVLLEDFVLFTIVSIFLCRGC